MEEALLKAFNDLDADHSGSLERNELKAALVKLNIFISQSTFDRLFRALDTDQDNTVDFGEFKRFVFDQPHDDDSLHMESQIHEHLKSRDPDARKQYVRSLMHSLSHAFEESMRGETPSDHHHALWKNARKRNSKSDDDITN
jgi:hypothetical protein